MAGEYVTCEKCGITRNVAVAATCVICEDIFLKVNKTKRPDKQKGIGKSYQEYAKPYAEYVLFFIKKYHYFPDRYIVSSELGVSREYLRHILKHLGFTKPRQMWIDDSVNFINILEKILNS